MSSDRIKIVEVGPRDGLQNESAPVATEAKVQLIRALAASGLTNIEATSFVHPKAIPQLADAADVAAELPLSSEDVTYSALVPNPRGLDRAIAAGFRRIAVFTAASDTFATKNINMSVDESLDVFAPVARRAIDAGMTVRGYISTAFVCPYEGDIDERRVLDVAQRLLAIGVDEVAISDTIGAAAPTDIRRVLKCVLENVPIERIALHLHDTYGTALANVSAGIDLGVRTFDASVGGLGGCPFAPGAAGNLATEDLVYMLDRMGTATGVDLDMLIDAARLAEQTLGRELPSRQLRRKRCG